jgi:hypothetical protein
MPATPVVAYAEAIHITSASGTTLASSNKLEETSEFTLNRATTITQRQNLNSSDGHTLVSATWHALSGSLSGRASRDSTVQGTMRDAEAAGTTAWIHVITHPDALTGAHMGFKYEVLFESYEESYSAGGLVEFSASFQVNGAPVEILAA